MTAVSRTETFKIDPNKLFDVIVDYDSYPEFVDGCDEIEVLERTDTGAKVRYHINLIKEFTYTLKMTHEKPNKVTWEFLEGDLFKENRGGWELKDLGNGETEVTYAMDVKLKLMAPKMMLNKLVAHNLPAMMKAYRDRANNV